jgi:hypothetical protein
MSHKDPFIGEEIPPGARTVTCSNGHINREESWRIENRCHFPNCGSRTLRAASASAISSAGTTYTPQVSSRPDNSIGWSILLLALGLILVIILVLGGAFAIFHNRSTSAIPNQAGQPQSVTNYTATQELNVFVNPTQSPQPLKPTTKSILIKTPTRKNINPGVTPTLSYVVLIDGTKYFGWKPCAKYFPSLLHVNERGYITPGKSNNVRSDAGIEDPIIGHIEPLEALTIKAGPVCNDGYIWWEVKSENGVVGWTAEGNGREYWILPINPP